MHVVFDLSSHGFGHVGMTIPIIAALAARSSGLRVTVRCGLPQSLLEERIPIAFESAPAPPDPGLAMLSPFEVDVATSVLRYGELFARWDELVQAEASKLRELGADLLIANVPFVSLAAAHASGVPAIALGPLNWADMYRAYCGTQRDADEIHAKILAAYRSARAFLQTTPSMPMSDLPNRRQIGPVARRGRCQREALQRLAAPGEAERLVLVSFGGIPLRRSFRLPRVRGVRWFVPDDYETTRGDVTRHSASGLSFIDLLASCEVLVTKPGYGMFVESACNGVKVAFLPRADWPESPYLTGWLQTAWIARELGEEAFAAGAIAPDIERLLAMPTPSAIVPAGVDDAVAVISRMIEEAR